MLKKLYNKSENGRHYITRDHGQHIWNIKTNKSIRWSHNKSVGRSIVTLSFMLLYKANQHSGTKNYR